MSKYETVKKQYETFKLQLKELEALEDQMDHAWAISGDDDRNEYLAWLEADRNARAMHKCVRVLAYELVVLEHKELGTSLTKLFKEYGIAVAVIRKLLAKNGVAYMRPTLVQWLPIGTAPKDGTKFLAIMAGGDMAEVEFVSYDEDSSEWRNYAYDPPNIEEADMTHWMPLPAPPELGEVK